VIEYQTGGALSWDWNWHDLFCSPCTQHLSQWKDVFCGSGTHPVHGVELRFSTM